MKPETLIEIIDAAHLSYYVDSPFKQRGGIMLIAPPGQMKTSIIQSSLKGYHDCLVMSDINVKTLINLRDDLIGGKYTTIAFTALEKLYARHHQTAANIEATLMALAEEGFTRASFEDQRCPMIPARALVIGGTFPAMINRCYKGWMESGFARRFLWCNYSLQNPKELLKSIYKWKPLDFGMLQRAIPISDSIEYTLTDNDSNYIMDILQTQKETTPFVLLKKIYCFLKWKYRRQPHTPQEIMQDFSGCLNKNGTMINLPKAECRFSLDNEDDKILIEETCENTNLN